MSDLQLRHANQSQWAELSRVGDHERVFTINSPDEGMELFNLLDESVTRCATCDKPMWTAVAGWCADGDRPWCCEHPPCNRLECDRKAVGL